MKFAVYPAGVYQANCYIIYDEKTMMGMVLDPGGDGPGIVETLNRIGIHTEFILLTHGHFDHTGAVNELKEKLKVPVLMNENDLYLVSGNDEKIKRILPTSDKIDIDRFIKDGETIEYGEEKAIIYETPGHTPGSVTISTGGCLFTGDTLFAGSVGRTDLPGGSQMQLEESIASKLAAFPDETKVYPGHGPSTTIGREKMVNPFF